MIHLFFACGLFVIHSSLLAVEIKVGSTRLAIPAPQGYAPITNDMKPYADVAKRFVPPSNEQFAIFLTEGDITVAARGEVPVPKRWFYVQSEKSFINTFVTSADFAKLKSGIKSQNERFLKDASAGASDLLRKATEGTNVNVSLNGMSPLPAHHETNRSLSYSAMLRYDVTDEQGKASVLEGVITTTFVHLQGKVLFLYATAEKEGLEWSQSQSKKWADSIIAANPSSKEIAARESGPSQFGFDWGRVLKTAEIGGIIGGIIGLISFLFKRATAKPT
jgi:hypothetical protein